MFSYLSTLSAISDKVSAFDCELQKVYTDIPYIYKKNLLFACLPILSIAFICLYWMCFHNLVLRRFQKLEPLNFQSVSARVVLTSWVMLFFAQSTLSKQAFQIFTCKTLAEEYSPTDLKYLQEDLNVSCYTPDHFAWMFSLGLITMIVYALGIPLGALWLLLRYSIYIYVHNFVNLLPYVDLLQCL
jgi:hypothetical protein